MPADIELQLFKKYKKNNFFVETGTYQGHGIDQALDAGYNNVISIELSEYYYHRARLKYGRYRNVKLVLGDSADVLLPTLLGVHEPMTIWLDGHYSCGKTALGKYWSPLMQELDAISQHPICTHTIIIDDMRCWNNSDNIDFGYTDIVRRLRDINNKYIFNYFKSREEYYPEMELKDWPKGLPGDVVVAYIDSKIK